MCIAFRDKSLLGFIKSLPTTFANLKDYASTFGSSTKAVHGINWANSVMVAYVVCAAQSLENDR